MLTNKAYLEVSDASTTYVFEFVDGVEIAPTVTKNLQLNDSGQLLGAITEAVAGIGPGDRTGANLDLGVGTWERTLTFVTGAESENIRWGDGDSPTGPNNVTTTDASGKNISRHDRMEVIEAVLAETRTDSRNPGYLYWNQWNDGTHGGAVGAHGTPMPVVVGELSVQHPVEDAEIQGSIPLTHTATVDGFQRQIGELADFG